ncbi:MAG: prephenate dehydratase [Sneathiella sp.]|jgi:prephenate dehydratase|uniref:prephenate dehydratase n=1 Tax=Sneathiella sp. TaxID=1964365 RepID=UPI000C3B501C|nr:prephenate dehydratase [Sneathiella sp.]MAL78890.1 prephenate dehydratase [Sneathiella sp.]|tara:strand:- start:4256 stop:5116 length:861 start_codon:yes stop_codon:yes gene_type:complete
MSDIDPDNRIAFQGVPGAYGHLSCATVYPEMEAIACDTFADTLAMVRDGDAALAMIPIENSLGGRVADIHHLLPESGLYIIGEHFQPVKHQLLGVPGATLTDVKYVHSHEQALSQCRGLIHDLKLEPMIHADTAGSAKMIAELGDKTQASIASSLAGEIYGLQVLRDRVEDRIGNTTRFVIMSGQRQDPDPRAGSCMTSFIFQVRSQPAALYKALGGFATNGINVTKLESYITDASFEAAQFYIDIEGHPEEARVARAIEELQFFSAKLKILGVYPMNPYRRQYGA